METTSPRTFGFQAEVKQLLHLMVHSLYSNREIFLRELISNASDANDKLRFESLARPALARELEIEVSLDPAAKTVSIADDGIGMTHDEIIEQLGTIAHSGTQRFVERLTGDQRKDSQLIGQFGVGFYSAFIVAERVEVVSRKAGEPAEAAVKWASDGQGEFTVEATAKDEPGTTVTLFLKEGAEEFLDAHRVRTLIRKYSDHIAFPVKLRAEASGEPETVNRAKALWTLPRNQIADEDYLEFYRHVSHDFGEPLAWTHNRVEGKREYTCLLYVPSTAPFDLWNREAPRGLKLYVQRVFITDAAPHFLPLYLRFVRGVVDASDLSLNVSRELLQEDPHVAAIKTALTKRVLDMLERLAKDAPEKYRVFWREFGAVLKEGLAEDPANRERIAELLRFSSTRSTADEQDRSLSDYVAEAKPEQDVVYYLMADSLPAARSSPHLEIFRDRGIEVLLMTDRLDEWAMQFIDRYREKPLKDVARGSIELAKLGDAPTIAAEPSKEDKHLLKRVKRVLRERAEEVRFSERLTESAACLVIGEEDIGPQMRELLKVAGHEPPESAPSLELNAGHPLIRRLGAEEDEDRFERLTLLIFEQAMLAEGRPLQDPAGFVKRLNHLLVELA
jgi:molecular chaperone HtpG